MHGTLYLCIYVLPDGFLFKLIDLNEIRWAEHEYINILNTDS